MSKVRHWILARQGQGTATLGPIPAPAPSTGLTGLTTTLGLTAGRGVALQACLTRGQRRDGDRDGGRDGGRGRGRGSCLMPPPPLAASLWTTPSARRAGVTPRRQAPSPASRAGGPWTRSPPVGPAAARPVAQTAAQPVAPAAGNTQSLPMPRLGGLCLAMQLPPAPRKRC
jgi:hypothetical protein